VLQLEHKYITVSLFSTYTRIIIVKRGSCRKISFYGINAKTSLNILPSILVKNVIIREIFFSVNANFLYTCYALKEAVK
jgi:hypothetical protein